MITINKPNCIPVRCLFGDEMMFKRFYYCSVGCLGAIEIAGALFFIKFNQGLLGVHPGLLAVLCALVGASMINDSVEDY
jgi:hypothetical protein